ncbi:molybdenum cofactor guanylyltransferase [Psychrobacter sp. TAE2020]|uniref:molybdenum cofactor guanylyltransferase n=1 Tax=Psychrobacter sp. TAE2020 TaxID=2846762 RepID=UPI001E332995|nr:NTP transferase domain-containing protein [Psychrobacter sp. TAE2020]
MTNVLANLAGVVILAGGASHRMGTPKAQLTLPTGESLLDYHVRQASELQVPIMIADNGRGFAVSPELLASNPKPVIAHIADYLPASIQASSKVGTITSSITNSVTDPQGPLVAIESALQALKKQPINQQALTTQPRDPLADANSLNNQQLSWLLVVSCDSLITAAGLWQQLRPCIDSTTDLATTEKSVICLTDESHLYPLLGLYRLTIESQLRAYIDSGQRKVMSFIEPISQAVAVLDEQQVLTNFNTPTDFKRAYRALYPQ